MKSIIFLIAILSACGTNAQEDDIKKSIRVFFEGLHTADTVKIKSVCAESIRLQSVSDGPAGPKLISESISAFCRSIASIPPGVKIEEKIISYNIQADGAMAHAWTPYEFYVNGKLSHSGVNSFQLFRDGGTWKIIYIIDTRHGIKQKRS